MGIHSSVSVRARYVVCFIIAIAIAALFFGLSVCKADEFVSTRTPMQYAVSDNGVWTVENGDIRIYSLDNESSMDVTHLDNIVHVASCHNGIACLVSSDGNSSLRFYGSSGVLFVECALPPDLYVQQIEIGKDDIIYLTATYDSIDNGEHSHDSSDFCEHDLSIPSLSVYRISMHVPDSLAPISVNGWDNEGVTSISADDEYLYAYSGENLKACVIDLQRMELVYEPISLSDADYIAAAPEDGVMRMFSMTPSDKSTVWLVNMQTGEKINADIDIPAFCSGLRGARNVLYTLSEDGKSLISFSVDKFAKKRANSITIVNSLSEDREQMSKAIELFQERYPDTDVLFRYIDDARVLSTVMMSGEPGCDIICAQKATSLTSSSMLLKTGAIQDLNKYEDIVALKPEFIDIFSALSVGDQLYGVPELIVPYVWEVNTALADKIDIDVPEGRWTWDDFFTVSTKVNEYNQESGDTAAILADIDYFPYIMMQYNMNVVDIMNGKADYDSETFIKYLKEWKSVCDDGLIKGSNYENALFAVCKTGYYNMESRNLILPPAFDESTRYPMEIISMELSSNSSDPEAAAYFLACYTSPEAILCEPIEYHGQWLKDIDRYSRLDIEISESNEKLWREIIENGIQEYYIGDLFRDQQNELYPKFMSGEMTAEQFAHMCQRRADIVLGE